MKARSASPWFLLALTFSMLLYLILELHYTQEVLAGDLQRIEAELEAMQHRDDLRNRTMSSILTRLENLEGPKVR